MKRKTTRKCLHCRAPFTADRRKSKEQRFCGTKECRKASKAKSQRQWLRKSENKNYFRGPDNSKRSGQWRRANPGYRRKKSPSTQSVQQDDCDEQHAVVVDVLGLDRDDVQQDVFSMQPALLVGLIAIMTGHVQQEDIAASIRSFLARGEDILRMRPGSPPIPNDEIQTHPVPGTSAARSSPV